MYDDIHLRIAWSCTSSPDIPFSDIFRHFVQPFSLRSSSLSSPLYYHYHRPPSYVVLLSSHHFNLLSWTFFDDISSTFILPPPLTSNPIQFFTYGHPSYHLHFYYCSVHLSLDVHVHFSVTQHSSSSNYSCASHYLAWSICYTSFYHGTFAVAIIIF